MPEPEKRKNKCKPRPLEKTCTWIFEDGSRCTAWKLRDRPPSFCYGHHPETAAIVAERMRKNQPEGNRAAVQVLKEKRERAKMGKADKNLLGRMPEASLAGLQKYGVEMMALIANGDMPPDRARAWNSTFLGIMRSLQEVGSMAPPAAEGGFTEPIQPPEGQAVEVAALTEAKKEGGEETFPPNELPKALQLEDITRPDPPPKDETE